MNSRTKKLVLLIAAAVIVVIVIAISTTYAFMKTSAEVSEITDISVQGCAKITLKDSGSINLSNAYAMSRNVALQKDPYLFDVKSSCDSGQSFRLYLATLNTNTLPASDIHYILMDASDNIISEGILGSASSGNSNFTTEELRQLNNGINGIVDTAYIIYNSSVLANSSNSYKLYLYIDEQATIPNTTKTFRAGLTVKVV